MTKALRKQDIEANLLAIVENADGVIYSIDRDFRYITLNTELKKRLRDATGIEPEVGDKVYGFLEGADPAEAKEWRDMYELALAGETVRFIKEFTYNGRQDFWSFSINPIRQHGEITGLACFARDVTELRRARLELEKSEERYRLVAENPLLGVAWCSLVGELLYLNETFCNMVGYTAAELVKMTCAMITHPEDHAREVFLLRALAKGEIGHYKFEKRYIRKDGKYMWAELNLTRVKNTTGEESCIGVIQDISHRKEAEDAILRLNEELEDQVQRRTAQLKAAFSELESFSYSVSHDLRSPLRLINGFVKILINETADRLRPDEREYLEIIGEKVVRMDALIKDMLKLSAADKAALTKGDVDMRTLVVNVLEEINYALGGHNADIHITDLPAAFCDHSMIGQVWSNLINNAIKYSGKKNNAKIEIGSTLINNETIYYVRDNGAGFDMKYAHKLFNAFQRLHDPADFEGTGVGLALVSRIISKHGGKIWAEGKVNEGATFYFSLS